MVLQFCLLSAIAIVHFTASRMRFLHGVPRSIWLSIAGGASVGYIFLHLLPQLMHSSQSFNLFNHELSIFIVALIGLCFIYGLEKYAKNNPTGRKNEIFWLHIFSYGLYNLLIGYLILNFPESENKAVVLFSIAMALHFLVNDSGLLYHHQDLYLNRGKWIIVATLLVGGLLGATVQVSEHVIHGIEAFLAGGIIMNVLKEELPENRKSRYWAFLIGVILYSALLIFLNEAE